MHSSLSCVVIREYAFNLGAHLTRTHSLSAGPPHIIYDGNWRIRRKHTKCPHKDWSALHWHAKDGVERVRSRKAFNSTANGGLLLVRRCFVNYYRIWASLLFSFDINEQYALLMVPKWIWLFIRPDSGQHNGNDSRARRHHHHYHHSTLTSSQVDSLAMVRDLIIKFQKHIFVVVVVWTRFHYVFAATFRLHWTTENRLKRKANETEKQKIQREEGLCGMYANTTHTKCDITRVYVGRLPHWTNHTITHTLDGDDDNNCRIPKPKSGRCAPTPIHVSFMAA